MKSINRLLTLTIVFNFLILIGAGHGIGFLGLIEIIGLKGLFQGDVKFSMFNMTGSYDNRLFTAATFAIVGQTIMIAAGFRKKQPQKFRLIYVGLFVLFFSFIILTKDILNSNIDSFSFWGGTPFLVLAILLLIKTIKNHRLTLS